MEILYASLAGLVFGSIISVFNFFLLKKSVSSLGENNSDPKAGTNKILKLYAIRYVLDVVALLAVFLLKDFLPFSWQYTALFTAVGLTVPMQILVVISGTNKKITNVLSGKGQDLQ